MLGTRKQLQNRGLSRNRPGALPAGVRDGARKRMRIGAPSAAARHLTRPPRCSKRAALPRRLPPYAWLLPVRTREVPRPPCNQRLDLQTSSAAIASPLPPHPSYQPPTKGLRPAARRRVVGVRAQAPVDQQEKGQAAAPVAEEQVRGG
jgi:hypothetical protein